MFVVCSEERVNYIGGYVTNHPVNVSLCKSIRKFRHRHYSDNEGIPAIEFQGCGATWVYEDEETRDKDFWRIVKGER